MFHYVGVGLCWPICHVGLGLCMPIQIYHSVLHVAVELLT